VHRVLVIPGDGIGPEVVAAAMKVLESVVNTYNISIEVRYGEAGDHAEKRYGTPLPQETLKLAVEWADAVLKGPVGESAGSVVIPLRRALDAYANIRPAKSLGSDEVDIMIVRENLEDVYYGIEFRVGDDAFAIKVVTGWESRRIARIAARYARSRRRRVTIVHKANVLKVTDGLFRDEARRVLEGESITVDEMYVDAAAMEIVRNPSRFDVILTLNQYGDILSDLAAEVAGSIGIAPSANIGDEKALFEPVHGAAWDIAGLNKANPTATILSTALMLDWLGYRDAAKSIEDAVKQAYLKGYTTPDVGGVCSTNCMADKIASLIR